MGFRLIRKSVTLNDLERRNGRYFALLQPIRQFKKLCNLQKLFVNELTACTTSS